MSRTLAARWGVACLAALVFAASPALAQPAPDGQPGGNPGGPGGGPRRFDPEQFRKMLSDRMKDVLGATDEEWQALQPRVEKVMTMQMQLTNIRQAMGVLFRRPGGGNNPGGNPGGRGPGAFFDQPSDVTDKAKELQDAVEKDAKPEEIKAKLAALRDARSKARAEMAKAQQELRELVTLKQEAILVGMGLLD